MNEGPLYVISSLKKIANLSKKMKIEKAILVVVAEMELGVAKYNAGLTKPISSSDMINGKFIGDNK